MGDRILLVGPIPPPTGGISSHMDRLGRALAAVGIGVSAVDPRGRLRFVTALGRAGLAGDLVHLHVCGHNPRSYGLLAACLAATPIRPALVTLHSGLLPSYLDSLTATARRTIAELLARAGATVAVSDDVADAIAALGRPRPEVVTPFIAYALRPGHPPPHVVAAGQLGHPLLCAAVAPGPEYGGPLLVAAFTRLAAQFPNSSLVLYGPGGADRAIARALTERDLGERVLALGELEAHEALGAMAACDVFLRPTLADGDSLSVREARAQGLRVVASDAARRPAGTTLFRAGDVDALCAAIATALAAPAPARCVANGLTPLLALYARLGAPAKEVAACAASLGG